MKKLLVSLHLGCWCSIAIADSPAPPVVEWGAGAYHIQYTTDGVILTGVPVGNPAQITVFGNINLALYASPDGTVLNSLGPGGPPDLSNWYIQATAPLQRIVPVPGNFPNTTIVLNSAAGAANSTVEMEAVGWTGNYPDFQSALASGNSILAWSGSALSGGSFGWEQITGDGTGPTPSINSSDSIFNKLMFVVPEPSTVMLGGLGLLGLLAVRRRK